MTEITKNVPSDLAVFDYGNLAGDGMDFASDELSTPFLYQLQTNSPWVADQVPGATPGKFYQPDTEKFYDAEPGVTVVNVGRLHVFIEKTPKEKGTPTMVDIHEFDSKVVQSAIASAGSKFQPLKTSNGNNLVETYTYALVVLDEAGAYPEQLSMFSFSSTKIKHMKRLNSALNSLRVGGKKPPLAAIRFRLQGFQDKNAQGKFWNVRGVPFEGSDWYSGLINPKTEMQLLESCIAMREQFVSGEVKVDYSKADAGNSESSEDDLEDF